MLKNNHNYIIIAISLLFFVQCKSAMQIKKDNFFKRYVTQMNHNNGYSFNVILLKKDLFSDDTIKREGSVSYFVENNSLEYIHIIEKKKNSEVLFLKDSLWSIDTQKKQIIYIGDGNRFNGNWLSSFFPMEGFFFPMEIFNSEPFWKFKNDTGSNIRVYFDIGSYPEGVTEINDEITIDTVELKLVNSKTETIFGDIGSLYLERKISNYKPLKFENCIKPDYFKTFSIDFGDSLKAEDSEKPDTIFVSEDLIFKTEDIKLVTLDQEPFILHSEGLIFIDLWYVGCYPCLRAAPEVEKAYYKYKDKVHFFSINDMDSDIEKIKRFKEKMKLTIPVLKTQGNKSITRPNQSNSYPYFVLFDAETGRVFWQQEGFPPDLEQKISEAIDKEIMKKY